METQKTIDEENVVQAIRNGSRKHAEILHFLGQKNFVQERRTLDRLLQALRRKKAIYFLSGGWRLEPNRARKPE